MDCPPIGRAIKSANKAPRMMRMLKIFSSVTSIAGYGELDDDFPFSACTVAVTHKNAQAPKAPCESVHTSNVITYGATKKIELPSPKVISNARENVATTVMPMKKMGTVMKKNRI